MADDPQLLAHLSILLVDDEPLVLHSMSRLLTRRGARVETARNGLEALLKTKQASFDWLSSDVRMPGMDGPSMLRELKARGEPLPQVVFVTGYADLTEAEALQLGAVKLLLKPTPLKTLLELILG